MIPNERTSYYVSTPRFTVRVDVAHNTILRTSARYIWRAYGTSWSAWIQDMKRRYSTSLIMKELP